MSVSMYKLLNFLGIASRERAWERVSLAPMPKNLSAFELKNKIQERLRLECNFPEVERLEKHFQEDLEKIGLNPDIRGIQQIYDIETLARHKPLVKFTKFAELPKSIGQWDDSPVYTPPQPQLSDCRGCGAGLYAINNDRRCCSYCGSPRPELFPTIQAFPSNSQVIHKEHMEMQRESNRRRSSVLWNLSGLTGWST